MNLMRKLTTPPWLAVILGGPALVLMVLLMQTGLDDRGLFIPGHWCGILLWLLAVVMVILSALCVQRYSGKSKYGRMFPSSTAGALGLLGAAVAMAWSALGIFQAGSGFLELLAGLLGLAAAAATGYLAWCRHRGLRAHYLLWSLAAAYLMLRLMFAYREWSGEPELLRYCFPLLGSVCLTLGFYYRCAFSVGMGSRPLYLFFTQTAGFFCLVCLGAGFDLFYLGFLAWCLLDLPSLRPMKTGTREELPEDHP